MANIERERGDVIGLETPWYYAIPMGKSHGFSFSKPKKEENKQKNKE